MRAVTFSEFGGPDVIEVRELDDPTAGPGQVLVAVAAASINPVDVKVRSGSAGTPEGAKPPYIVGWDLAGRIVAVGEGVDARLLGSYVVGFSPWFAKANGTHAQLVALDAGQVAVAPESIAPEALTTLGLNALTGFQAVDAAAPAVGTTVLVTGASGAVGGYVVEFAAKRGATVLAMASEDDEQLVLGFGAARRVARDAAGAVAELGPMVDVVIDTASIGAGMLGAIRDGGRYFTVTAPIEGERGIETKRVGAKANGAHLAEVVRLAVAGEIAIRVERTFPMEEAVEAYRYLESGKHRGRVVLVF